MGGLVQMTGFRLALQFVDFLRISRAMMPIDSDNQRQPNGGLSGGNGNGEQNEQQSVQRLRTRTKTPKGDKVQVGRIQHQFNSCQNQYGVPSDQNCGQSQTKQESAQNQITG